jgi:hypothetical protein
VIGTSGGKKTKTMGSVKMTENFIVICREDKKEDGSLGDYSLVTRTIFPNKGAAEKFAAGCASEREAIVVGGRFTELRQDFAERFGYEST